MGFAGKNNDTGFEIYFNSLRIDIAHKAGDRYGFAAFGHGGFEVERDVVDIAVHAVAVIHFDIIAQFENIGLLIVMSGRRFDVYPALFVKGHQTVGIGEPDHFGAGSGFVDVVGGKVMDFIVFVGDVEDGFFDVEFFQFAFFGTGDVQKKFFVVFLDARENHQQADKHGGNTRKQQFYPADDARMFLNAAGRRIIGAFGVFVKKDIYFIYVYQCLCNSGFEAVVQVNDADGFFVLNNEKLGDFLIIHNLNGFGGQNVRHGSFGVAGHDFGGFAG